MIIVVNELSTTQYCLMTDQLFHRRATQTTETNIANATKHVLRIPAGGPGDKPFGYLQAKPKHL